jgi:hypothetical protein
MAVHNTARTAAPMLYDKSVMVQSFSSADDLGLYRLISDGNVAADRTFSSPLSR